MPDNSFDVVSKIDLAEVSNAVQQALAGDEQDAVYTMRKAISR